MSDTKPDWENFSKAVLADWPTGDLEGSVLFDLSLQYGMIKEVPGGYNSDHHFDNDGICPEEGDPWYEYTFGGEAGPGLYSIAEMKNTIAALTAQVAELEVKLGGALLGQWIDAGMPNDPAEAEAAALRAKLARIASAWPIVRDADCSGGTLASAMDEIEAAISDGAADGGKHE